MPEVPSTFTKMAAFYQCLKPEPRWASESQEVVVGGGRRRGGAGGGPATTPSPWGPRIDFQHLLSCMTFFLTDIIMYII